MLTACWSVKGGSGTTVVAATLALGLLGVGRPVVAADFAGDLPVALGVAEPSGPGLLDWLGAGPHVPDDALGRLAHLQENGLTIIARGDSHAAPVVPPDADTGRRLADALRAVRGGSPVIADCGRSESSAMRSFIAAADRSFLVLRPCYLALRRAVAAPRPTAVVLITEPDRSLSSGDIEDVLGVPVATEIALDPAVARAVDAGLLGARLPRHFTRAMRAVA